MDLQLGGKRALVTGSSAGLGKGIALTLADEGAVVVVHGRDPDRAAAVVGQIRQAGGTAHMAIGDLATDEGAQSVAGRALDLLGGVDILVNNAGGSTVAGVGTTGRSGAEWLADYDNNLVSAVRMVELLQGQMVERGWGRLIQIGSLSALYTGGRSPTYSAAKAAMANYTLALAKSLAFTGVTANTIAPGLIETELTGRYFDKIGKEMGWGDDRARSVDHAVRNYVRQTVSRLGTPEDIGFMVAVLCSPRGDYITGANYRVDGGIATGVY